MKLWLLQPREHLPRDMNPWEPWYDRCFGFVIRANNEEEARLMADKESGRESHYSPSGSANPGIVTNAWIDPKLSTCVEISIVGDSEIILSDVRYA